MPRVRRGAYSQEYLDIGRTMTAADIKAGIAAHYAVRDGFVCFPEFRDEAGFDGTRSIDMLVIGVTSGSRFRRIAFEIKTSRSDFLREIADPIKSRAALYHTHQFYFAAPPGLIAAAELPLFAGLRTFWRMPAVPDPYELTKGRQSPNYVAARTEGADTFLCCHEADAPIRDTEPATPGFVASIARRASAFSHIRPPNP